MSGPWWPDCCSTADPYFILPERDASILLILSVIPWLTDALRLEDKIDDGMHRVVGDVSYDIDDLSIRSQIMHRPAIVTHR